VRPLLKPKDIKTLAAVLGLSDTAFCETYLVDSEEDDGFNFNTLPCPFLEGNLCTVYSSRPDDCRSFPHLENKDRIFSLSSILSNLSVCPIVYNVYELLKQELSDPEQM
jgi:Fe-S-cluster containining protein